MPAHASGGAQFISCLPASPRFLVHGIWHCILPGAWRREALRSFWNLNARMVKKLFLSFPGVLVPAPAQLFPISAQTRRLNAERSWPSSRPGMEGTPLLNGGPARGGTRRARAYVAGGAVFLAAVLLLVA